MQYTGSCHCGAVQFEVEAPNTVTVQRCNCSICSMSGFLHLIVPKSKFRITSGDDQLQLYQFNSKVAKHYFCRVCGIKPFYVPRSNPDGWDVNLRCLSPPPRNITIEDFDGQNWEANAANLTHLSKDD